MLQTAIILAGGFGTRLQTVVKDLPKPMAQVNGEPFLNYQLRYLNHFGIKHVVFSTGHLSEKISDYYKDEFLGIKISYAKEETPLGTGGGIRLALEQCAETNVLVLNGDSFFDVDLNLHFSQHSTHKADCSLAMRRVENAARYGTIKANGLRKIYAFKEKDGEEKQGLINGGVYILNKDVFLQHTEANKNFSIEKDFFEKKVSELNIFGFEYQGYFIDIGIPEDFSKAQKDFVKFEYK